MRRFTAGDTQGMIDYGDYQVYYDWGKIEQESKEECEQECKEEHHSCYCERVKCKKPSLVSRCYCCNHNIFYQVGRTTL